MILTAHQPVYLPWLGLFHKIYLADTFCLFDIVQYQTKDYNNRNKIKLENGNESWLSVPVLSKNHFEKIICDIEIVQDGWIKKHCRTLKQHYAKAPFFKLYYEAIESILHNEHKFLTDLNFELLNYFLAALQIHRNICKASDYDFAGQKSELVLDMCRKLGTDCYIFGSQGRDYAVVNDFEKENIQVVFQDYAHPIYQQLHGQFLPYLSIVDLLFNMGPNSLKVLLSGNIQNIAA
jgi:hypothetical protein